MKRNWLQSEVGKARALEVRLHHVAVVTRPEEDWAVNLASGLCSPSKILVVDDVSSTGPDLDHFSDSAGDGIGGGKWRRYHRPGHTIPT